LLASDARVLWHLLRGQPRIGSHAERLQTFYGPQANRYDDFRERLLQGREDLIDRLQPPSGGRIVELGAGTGRNLLFFGDRLATFEQVELVDLCPALLAEARRRTADMPNVRVIEGDAVHWRPKAPVDVVYFSYALTMIPDWRGAVDNAVSMLKPGGLLGVVDFYVSDTNKAVGKARHSAFDRALWPRWFRHDGVHLNPDHLHYLAEILPAHELIEARSRIPYLMGLKVPYYQFLGQTPAH